MVVRILADSSQTNVTGGEIPLLEELGFAVKRRSGISGGLMHNKYVIIDGEVPVTGSYNWSANAEERSFENVVIIRDSSVIQEYLQEFEKIWEMTCLLPTSQPGALLLAG